MVGSGAGARTAAWTAARAGLGVLVAEATDLVGGTSAYSGGGLWFPGNRLLAAPDPSRADEEVGATARDYFHAVVGDRTPRELQEAFLDAGPRLVDALLADEAIELEPFAWPDYFGAVPGAATVRQVRPRPLDRRALGPLADLVRPPLKVERSGTAPAEEMVGGQALIARLLLALSRLPAATLRTSVPVIGLRTDAAGRVSGVLLEGADGPRPVGARLGVVVAAGGFERNARMRAEHGVAGVVEGSMGCPGNHGLAMQAAIGLGAEVDLMDQAWWAPGIAHPDGTTSFSLWFTGGIFVDAAGRRFVNESGPYDRLGRTVIEARAAGRLGSGAASYWMVYDDREGPLPPVRSTTVALEEPQAYVDAGLWHTSDTLGGLAALIGVPADELEATVTRFNEHAAAGRDPDLGRGDEPYDRAFAGGGSPLVPIEKGPFHAAAFGLCDLGTKGGLRTDPVGRVLRPGGEPIRGLYAAGNSMAAVTGTTYPGGGNPIAASMVFGHLAGLDLAALDLADSRATS